MEEIIINVLKKDEYLTDPIEIGLDEDWVKKSVNFDQKMKMQGVYIFHTSAPFRILYVGKTRGSTMDFRTRLYRHAIESASQSNPKVYKMLKRVKQETGVPITVSLVTTEKLQTLFKGKKLEDPAMIDIYEQVLIHLLKPEIQDERS
jgi:hypothetical protein